MKILVIRFSAMGDVAMLSPVIKEVVEQNKNVDITVLSRDDYSAFFKGRINCGFEGVDLNNYRGILGIYKLFKKLKRDNYNAIADVHNVLRSIILRFFFKIYGVKIAVLNKGRKDKKLLISRNNKKLVELKHTTERYADVFRELGLKVRLTNRVNKNIIPTQYFSDNFKIKSNIGIAPFAKHVSKQYPIDRIKNIISTLSNKYNIFLFGGGREEIEILEKIKSKNNNVYFFKNIGLDQEIALISNLDLMITMDSANMHIASLVGTKVVSIWGATHYFAGFLGYAQDKNNIIEKKMGCRPCSIFGGEKCFIEDKYKCLKIEENIIIDKIEKCI